MKEEIYTVDDQSTVYLSTFHKMQERSRLYQLHYMQFGEMLCDS